MELHFNNDVSKVQKNRNVASTSSDRREFQVHDSQQAARMRQAAAAKAQAQAQAQKKKTVDPEIYLKDILTITSIFNRKLRFSINRESNQVVVKVIDGETDKVIKEIPPEALQRLHSRMRETIGLLIDEEI
ncbi:MAG TPA: flagellar protein FlaG [Clostridia bacterium]|nr:flagellar protein FlaG [Clostridia bacterium]